MLLGRDVRFHREVSKINPVVLRQRTAGTDRYNEWSGGDHKYKLPINALTRIAVAGLTNDKG